MSEPTRLLTILLALSDANAADGGDFARRHLRSHVLPALNQRFAHAGVQVQFAPFSGGIDESQDHVVRIAPYSVNDLAEPNRDVVEEIAQLVAAEALEATIASAPPPDEADDAANSAPQVPPGGTELKLPYRIGNYVLKRSLGRGGMGVVYAAEQENVGCRPVAVKLLLSENGNRIKAKRFQFEVAILARMQHPNIVTLYDAGRGDDGTMWMAMELVYGQTLLCYCDNHRLTVQQRLELFAKLCDAVSAIHSKGVIHRNLSPHNVLVTTLGERPVVKVVDFGIARLADHRDPLIGPREAEGQLYGSLAYMAPEQAIGAGNIDTRADIYVLGVVLYELLTGQKALAVDSREAMDVDLVVQRILTRPVPPPSAYYRAGSASAAAPAQLRRSTPRALAKQLRSGLDDIVLSCVAKNPAERYAAAHQIAKDIRAWQPKRGFFST